MTVATIKQNLFSPSEEMQMKYTLWMNHLLVIYAFLLPISTHGRAQAQFMMIILFFFRGNFKKFIKPHFKNKVIIAFLLYFLLYIVWLIGTENFHYAIKLISQNKYAFFFPLLILSFIDRRFTKYIISGFLLGILFSEITSYSITLAIIPWRYDLFGKELYEAYTEYDPSPFLHHSKYGLILALGSVFLLLNILIESKKRIFILLSMFFLFTITLNMSITGGRIGYLTYVVLILSLIILHYKNKAIKPIIITLVIISIIASLAYSYSPLFKTRINYTLQTISKLTNNILDFDSSFGARLGMWFYSSKVIKDNFLFGVGTGDHVDEIKKYVLKESSPYKVITHPHNQYVSIFTQFGIIGLFIFLNIFYQIFTYKYKVKKNFMVSILSTLAIAMTFLIEGDLVKLYLPLWILFVSISLIDKEYNFNNKQVIKTHTLLYYIIGVICILIFSFFI